MFIILNGREVSEEKRNKLQKLIRKKIFSDDPAGLAIDDRIYFVLNPGSATDVNGHESVCVEIKLGKGEEEKKALVIERLIKSKIELKKGVELTTMITRI